MPEYAYSTIVNDAKGNLLSATVASDGQWRFPKPDSVPHRVSESIRYFEDEYFYWHPGINPASLLRAVWQNARDGKVVSGASTINMQIARMMANHERTLSNKLAEMMVALKLGLMYSKKELMIDYASMAPFGGNVVGLEAASWRYYGRSSHLLSWAEAATLAVLPNNPGSIFPGTQDSLLIRKRNRLLYKLKENELIDLQTYELSLLEPVPSAPLRIPTAANHLLTTFSKHNPGKRLSSTLDPFWQSRVTDLVEAHHQLMIDNGVDNVAALVVELSSGRVLTYKGNTDDANADGYQVDMLQRARSPGSSLKPLLFAAALDKGFINRKTLLPDVPSFFGGFSPKNFNNGYSGVVPANVALSRSLNIPYVHLLQTYTYEQFHQDLRDWGFSSLDKPAGHYGLTLALGGCEVTPWELANVYFAMYRKLTGQPNRSIHFEQTNSPATMPSIPLGADAIWQTFQTMTTLARPEGERTWRTFSSSQLIAWKTGTSHGFRDAWAVGLNSNVLVIVWVGNADGEGRADLTGIKAAAPLMHRILRLSPNDPNWLKKLKPFFSKEKVCTVSGMLANTHCPAEEMEVTQHASRSGLCPYHKTFVLDKSGTYRVSGDCYALHQAVQETVFVLPPVQGYYYQQEVPDYRGIPPLHPDCTDGLNPIGIIYPNFNSKVFIPKEMDGSTGRAIFKATHQVPGVELFWHVDEIYLGKTTDDHQQAVWLPAGSHMLTVMDAEGHKLSRPFEVIGENR
jgi:penicillin-binding protein 1C